MSVSKSIKFAGLLGLSCVLLFGPVARGTGQTADAPTAANTANDSQIQMNLAKALKNKRFKGITSNVQDGIVTLRGTVDVYSDKDDADKRAHRIKNVKSVQNLVEIGGPVVEDATLRNKLAEKLVYDRVGYGTTAFNALTIAVKDGVVSLGGTAYGPVDRDSAVSLVSNYPGVKDVVDNINVAPVSPMDDRIRLAEARAIYGAPQLNRYALDPAKPIRITVINGNVTLSGVVDSQSDKNIAGIRANGVGGVFKVVNNLQVAGAPVQNEK
ncbi:MAG: BON domain-containing protein [Edaphobacter sp.]